MEYPTPKKEKQMPNPTKVIVDCSTGITTEVELTAEEMTQREAEATAFATAEAERTAQASALAVLKASAKAKLIAGTPLTAEEADKEKVERRGGYGENLI